MTVFNLCNSNEAVLCYAAKAMEGGIIQGATDLQKGNGENSIYRLEGSIFQEMLKLNLRLNVTRSNQKLPQLKDS